MGLASKKDLVKHYIIENNIAICCLQETDLDPKLNENLLTFPGYSIEVERNDVKKRVAIYVSNQLDYKRRDDLEGSNNHLVIIDLLGTTLLRIITIYRSFKPQDNTTPREKFEMQLNLIKNSITSNCVILGDFNIDYSKKFDTSYASKQLFSDFESNLSHFGLFQHVDFSTWSRIIGGCLKQSILDHIYTRNPTLFSNTRSITPTFGDHLLVLIDIVVTPTIERFVWRRDWRFYNVNRLSAMLSRVDWNINVPDVQQFWNLFETKLLSVIDVIAPYTKFCNNEVFPAQVNKKIKTLLNASKNLFKKFKVNPSVILKTKIKSFDTNIKFHFFQEKRKKVRRGILPGNSKSLWTAVRIAKDQNIESLPKTLYSNGIEIPKDNVAEAFAGFFDAKVKDINL